MELQLTMYSSQLLFYQNQFLHSEATDKKLLLEIDSDFKINCKNVSKHAHSFVLHPKNQVLNEKSSVASSYKENCIS